MKEKIGAFRVVSSDSIPFGTLIIVAHGNDTFVRLQTVLCSFAIVV